MKNLRTLLTENVNGATFISLDSKTEVKLTKTIPNPHYSINDKEEPKRIPNPHFERVTKVTEGLNVMVFQNKTTNSYENMVNRRLTSEGFEPKSFTVGPRTWGSRIPNTCFVEHKGQHYLEVICMKQGTTTYQLNGQPFNREDVLGMSKPKEGSQGGLSDKVIIRTYNVDNITQIKVNKQTVTDLYFK